MNEEIKKDFDTKGSKKREDEKKTAAAKGTGNMKIVQGYNKRGSAVSLYENIFREGSNGAEDTERIPY